MKKLIKPRLFACAVAAFALLFVLEALLSKSLSYHFSFVGYGGTFKNNDITVLGIPMYWFLMISGLLISVFFSLKSGVKYNLSRSKSILLPIIFLFLSFLGGKLLYIAENFKYIKEFSFSGLSLFGAIFLILLATPIIAVIFKTEVLMMYDYLTPFGLILLSCVRTGCFFNGCCEAKTIWVGNNPIVLPVQLFEVILDLLILDVCLHVGEKFFESGFMYPLFMIMYGIERFLLEFLRKSSDAESLIHNGHVFSLLSIVIGLIFIVIIKTKLKRVSQK